MLKLILAHTHRPQRTHTHTNRVSGQTSFADTIEREREWEGEWEGERQRSAGQVSRNAARQAH